MRRLVSIALATCLLLAAAMPARAAETPYDSRLMRLAEILGSLHYLRNLCGEAGDRWRDEMETLLQAENPEPDRRALLVARFNHGYRSFGGVYTVCTDSANAAIQRYVSEGEALTRDIASRYGN